MAFSAAAMDSYKSVYVDDSITCDWQAMSALILDQWKKITPDDLERTFHSRHNIALLISNRYGVHAKLVENYLRNLERTMPLFQ